MEDGQVTHQTSQPEGEPHLSGAGAGAGKGPRLFTELRTMFHIKVSSSSCQPGKYRYVTSNNEPSFSKVKVVFGQFRPIAGQLQYFVENWQVVLAWVLAAISGYHIPITIKPHQNFLPSHRLSVEDEILIDKELGELIQKQVVHLVSEHDYNIRFVSNLFNNNNNNNNNNIYYLYCPFSIQYSKALHNSI